MRKEQEVPNFNLKRARDLETTISLVLGPVLKENSHEKLICSCQASASSR